MTINEVANPNKVVMVLLGEAIRRGAISLESLITWAKEGQFPAKDWDDFRILCGREKKLPNSGEIGDVELAVEDSESKIVATMTAEQMSHSTVNVPPDKWTVYCLRRNFSWFWMSDVEALGTHYEEIRPQGNANYVYQLVDESRKLAFATEA